MLNFKPASHSPLSLSSRGSLVSYVHSGQVNLYEISSLSRYLEVLDACKSRRGRITFLVNILQKLMGNTVVGNEIGKPL